MKQRNRVELVRDAQSHRPAVQITLTPEQANVLAFVLARVGGWGRARGFMLCLLDDLRGARLPGPVPVTTQSPFSNLRGQDVLYIYDSDIENGSPKWDGPSVKQGGVST